MGFPLQEITMKLHKNTTFPVAFHRISSHQELDSFLVVRNLGMCKIPTLGNTKKFEDSYTWKYQVEDSYTWKSQQNWKILIGFMSYKCQENMTILNNSYKNKKH